MLGREAGAQSYRHLRNTWLYEYQVVVREGQVTGRPGVAAQEQNEKARGKRGARNPLPLAVFGVPAGNDVRRRQATLFLLLRGKTREDVRSAGGAPCRGVADGYEELGAGTAWVDEETGAVLKIELAQRAIKGIEAAEKRAQRSGARLLVSDVHYYGIERDGVWLPSSTTIFEYYVISVFRGQGRQEPPGREGGVATPARMLSSSNKRQLELSRTWVEYSDFKFFVVDVQAKEEP